MRQVAQNPSYENTPVGGTLLVEFEETRENPHRPASRSLSTRRRRERSGRGATSERYGAGYDQTEARRIMAEGGGMRVVSFAEFAGENPGLWEQAKSLLR